MLFITYHAANDGFHHW